MVTHRNEFRVRTTVVVSASGGGTPGVWPACPELPELFAETRIRTCLDLLRTLETQGGIVARLIARSPYKAFRVLARDTETGGLAGYVEWVRSPGTGRWVQWDEPLTCCAHGCHQPAPTMLEAA
ncbi:hypothetical protein ACIQWA_39710 [Kitasatospora sp. NPDC098652]|uniref:hypothetical protein n=1 Tax=Kitasatospora sp. NPDC098652 TaxID=3364095 RepID=UPI0038282B2A